MAVVRRMHYTKRSASTRQMPLTLTPARTAQALDEAKQIFGAYAAWIEHTLGYSLSRQSFEEEMASLPGRYAPPRGDILIAYVDGKAAGAIAFYPLERTIAELKRFYVLPEMAGRGVGGALFDAILHLAKERGYSHIRLDTLKGMTYARSLYARYAFRQIPPYNNHHTESPGLLYYELDLGTI